MLPPYFVNLAQPIRHKESHIFALFVPVLTALCMVGLKVLELPCTFL